MSFSPAVFFVVVFTKLGKNEREARQRAEELTAELEPANRQLAAYAIQAEELATTQERNRLAREIHDNLGHYLTGDQCTN
ncbi:MAG: histidine kinase [Chloroflexi bacterium]|nr:histidine kinase [Chloroflexota bacterium]